MFSADNLISIIFSTAHKSNFSENGLLTCRMLETHGGAILFILFSNQLFMFFCPLLPYSRMMCANNGAHYDAMVVFVCLHIALPHYHHYADLSQLLNFLNALVSNVCQRLSQFSQLYFIRYMGLCVFNLPNSLMRIVRICVLYLIIFTKTEVWPIWIVMG